MFHSDYYFNKETLAELRRESKWLRVREVDGLTQRTKLVSQKKWLIEEKQ